MISLVLKVILCSCAFTTAFLSVFRKTVDDKGRITRHGKICILCVCVTFFIGVGNELMNLDKETRSALEKKTADDRSLVIQTKLDQALASESKRSEEAKRYMVEAEISRRHLEDVRARLSLIGEKVSDPTVNRMILDVKKLAGNDTLVTGEKLTNVQKILEDIHNDLGEARSLTSGGQDLSRSIRTEVVAVRTELSLLRSDVSKLQVLVPKPQTSTPADGGDDAGKQFFEDGEKLN